MNIRPATEMDMSLVFEWRNNPQTWRFFISPAPVDWESHCNWFLTSLQSTNRRIFIAVEKVAVGVVRYDQIDSSCWELSWYLGPEFYGQGLGSKMLAAAVENWPTSLLAKIKAENIASQKVAAQNGFKVKTQENDLLVYFRDKLPSKH